MAEENIKQMYRRHEEVLYLYVPNILVLPGIAWGKKDTTRIDLIQSG